MHFLNLLKKKFDSIGDRIESYIMSTVTSVQSSKIAEFSQSWLTRNEANSVLFVINLIIQFVVRLLASQLRLDCFVLLVS